MYKKKRRSIYHFESQDPTLLLYRPYFSVFLLPPRTTFTGEYERKICYSIGRTFDPGKARKFFSTCGRCGEKIDIRKHDKCPNCGEGFEKKRKIAEQWAKELKLKPEDVIKATMDGTIRNLMIKVWKKATEKLDIPLYTLPIKRKASYQVFEYLKTRDVGEAFQMVMGTLIALGATCKLFAPDKLEEYRKKVMGKAEKMMIIGFNKVGEEME